ncbi:MAG: hypothetical protein IH983_11270 [Planctomycetes bacterium]|nr:hypothetical protein [Planctomycetota bacterium]
MTSLWNKPGVPHKGWRCVNIYDVREGGSSAEEAVYATCEMCGKTEIRFVHTMEHDEYGTLDVGCICAGKMEEDYEGAQRREATFRNRAARRAKWLSRKWRTSAKGNHYINAEGHNLVVFPNKFQPGRWKFSIDGNFSSASYDTPDEAKLALFDAFWSVIEGDHRRH